MGLTNGPAGIGVSANGVIANGGTANGAVAKGAAISGAAANGKAAGDASALPSLGDRPTIKDEIYAALRERIVFGEFGPGDRLIEADLAARFGVSKTPVREALLTLEAEGLVTLRPHRGAVVSPLSVAEYRDLQFVRDALEFGAIDEVVATTTDALLAAAEADLAEMGAAFAVGDYRRYRRAQRELHRRLLSAPGCPTLPELAVHLNDRLDRYGRLLVDGRRERWAGDLEFNRLRVALIRAGAAADVVRLVKERHGEALRNMPALLERAARSADGRSTERTPTDGSGAVALTLPSPTGRG